MSDLDPHKPLTRAADYAAWKRHVESRLEAMRARCEAIARAVEAQYDGASERYGRSAARDIGDDIAALKGPATTAMAGHSPALVEALTAAWHALQSYAHGNASPDLAICVAEICRIEIDGLAEDIVETCVMK